MMGNIYLRFAKYDIHKLQCILWLYIGKRIKMFIAECNHEYFFLFSTKLCSAVLCALVLCCFLVILLIHKIRCYSRDLNTLLALSPPCSGITTFRYHLSSPSRRWAFHLRKYSRVFIYQVKDRWKEIAKMVYIKAFNAYNCIKDCFKAKATQCFSNTKLP